MAAADDVSFGAYRPATDAGPTVSYIAGVVLLGALVVRLDLRVLGFTGLIPSTRSHPRPRIG